MNSEELKQACEQVGLEIHPHPIAEHEWCVYIGCYRVSYDNPLLPAYLAELLMAVVRGRTHVMRILVGEPMVDKSTVTIKTDPAAPGWITIANVIHPDTTTAIIRACMSALL